VSVGYDYYRTHRGYSTFNRCTQTDYLWRPIPLFSSALEASTDQKGINESGFDNVLQFCFALFPKVIIETDD
jgi:hypothetical protein